MVLDVAGTILGWAVGKGADAGLRLAQGSPEHTAVRAAVDAALAGVVNGLDDEVQDAVLAELFRCFDAGERPTLVEFGVDPKVTRDAIDERLKGFKLPEHRAVTVDTSGFAEQIADALQDVLRDADAGSSIAGSARRSYHNEAMGRFDEAVGRIDGLGESIRDMSAGPPVDMKNVACPPGTDNLPWANRLFLGRTEDLEKVTELLEAPGPVVVAAVHGLGGIGKSALALRYAIDHRDDYAPVWWIAADQDAGIQQGLAALARKLQPALVRAVPADQLPELAVQWLQSHSEWLLILDNVENPNDVPDLLAGIRTGRVLITSRCTTGWNQLGASSYTLDVLDDEHAEELLRRIITTANPHADLTGATELCGELGGLPLAVEQAAAYIAQTRITPADYLHELQATPAPAFARAAEHTDPERTVARIWQHTMNHLDTTAGPLPATVLGILSWYAPEAIPTTLITALDDVAEKPELSDALGKLAAYSMITHHGTTLTVHRLVQAITRTTTPTDTLHHATHALLAHLNPDVRNPAAWPTYQALIRHVDAINIRTPQKHATPASAQLRNRAGIYLLEQGALTSATAYLTQALTDRERVLGPGHPNTLGSRNNLAYAYQAAGDLGRAIPLYEAVLTDRTRVLGPDHPDTLTSRNSLAGAYESAGDLGRAIPLFEAVLTDSERVLGADHPDTLTSRNSLAGAYQAAGDLGRAIPLYKAVLTDSERVLGADHPNTLISRNNLAYAYESAGDLGRAIPLYKAVLTDFERVLGADHPNTLISRNNLAYAYRTAGDLARAIPLYEAVLTDRTRVLGPDHPDTLTSRNNLAGAYQAAGDLGRAIPLYEAVLTDRTRVLGPDHPDTLISRNNLAGAYRTAGDLARAIPLYEAVLTDRTRVLGPDHPGTLISRNNLAGAYQAAGDLGRAIPLYEAVLTDRTRVLGPDHPDTLTSRNNLAGAYESAGDLGRAIPLYKAVLTDFERVLGADHPNTLISRNNLAGAYESAGDLGRAIPLYKAVLTDFERVLGADHPNTLTSRNNLAGAYQAAGDLGRAIPLYEAALAGCERVLGADHPTTGIVRRNLAAAREADPGAE